MKSAPSELYDLAELNNIQLAFTDVNGGQRIASADTLLQLLQSLDVPIERFEQSADLLREARLSKARRLLEPVLVIWEGQEASFVLRIPHSLAGQTASCRIITEDGAVQSWQIATNEWIQQSEHAVEGYRCLESRGRLPSVLPPGYHRLEVTLGSKQACALILAAEVAAFTHPAQSARRWGVFLPLYALHSANSCGAGDFGDLAGLNEWVADQGGSLVATLPLLASFYEQSGDESPYRPVSRLFWNEFFLDVRQIPELPHCTEALRYLESNEVQKDQRALRSSRVVDYSRQMQLKRGLLQRLSHSFFQNAPAERRGSLDEFLRRTPDVVSYARFRAADRRLGRPWMDWPEKARNGELVAGNYDEADYHYHLYVQWLVDEQLTRLARLAQQRDLSWYLDLPLGVHPFGFDVWQFRDAFAMGVSGGAPPDNFFTKGQFWDFLPIHPQRIRQQGYRYVLAVLRAHLRYAKVLRIDHVMGLHRLYWIPAGIEASQGAYVRYAADELYAVVSIESQRHRARIIGEDLGTVPPEVGQAMERHKIGRLYVVQYECRPHSDAALPDSGANAVASLNTHDMPPFAAFWQGLDIDDRQQLGLIPNDQEVEAERNDRQRLRQALIDFFRKRGLLDAHRDGLADVLEACLAFISSSAAEVALVNLEDLWLETYPQNTPGTVTQRINWRRRAKLSLEEMRQDPQLQRFLHAIRSLRPK